MKKTRLFIYFLAIIGLTGCGSPTMDATDSKSLDLSSAEIKKSMETEKSIVFDRARKYLKSKMSRDHYRVLVNGLTGKQVIEEALIHENEAKEKDIAELQQSLNKDNKIREILNGIEFVDAYSELDEGAPMDNASPGIAYFIIKYNGPEPIYGFRVGGTVVRTLSEPFVKVEYGRKIKFLPGEYEFNESGDVDGYFTKTPIQPGETRTYSKPSSEFGPGRSGYFLTFTQPLFLKQFPISEVKLNFWGYFTQTEKGEFEFIKPMRDDFRESLINKIETTKNRPSKVLVER